MKLIERASILRQEFAALTKPVREGKAVGRRKDGRLYLARQIFTRAKGRKYSIHVWGDYLDSTDLPTIDLPDKFQGSIGKIDVIYHEGWQILGGG